ncbi:MAG: hypothetical protein ABI461_17070 [Polyangiaceae bacterium]
MGLLTATRWITSIAIATGVASALSFAGCSDDDRPTPVEGDSGVALDAARDVVVIGDEDAAPDANLPCTTAPDAASYGDAAISMGLSVVESFGCEGCHTGELSGSNTPIGIGVFPKNLTPDPTTGLGCWTDAEISRAMRIGIDKYGEHLCVMPQFDGTIDDAGVAAVIAYLRSLPPVKKEILPSSCPQDAGED